MAEVIFTIGHVLQFITFLILIWAWGTFIAYVSSNRKLLSTEFKSIVFWVMTGILFFAMRTTLELLSYILLFGLTNSMLLILNIFSFSSAFAFVISAYHLYRFSKKYGFAEKVKKMEKRKK